MTLIQFKENLLKRQIALLMYDKTLEYIRHTGFEGNITETCDSQYLTVKMSGKGAFEYEGMFDSYFKKTPHTGENELIMSVEFESIDL
jgi:hypothetical protein